MNINATLLVQAANFFVAYFLFRNLLLKPAYQAIEHEDTQRQSLRDQIEAGKEHYEQQRMLGVKRWDQLHTFYKNNRLFHLEPVLLFRGISGSIEAKPVTSAQVAQVADKLAHVLIHRLGEL